MDENDEYPLRLNLEDDLADAAEAYQRSWIYTFSAGERHTRAMRLYTAALAYKGYTERFEIS
jgi:hypothetical protein